MGRSPCCDENGLKKGPWTPEEDQTLVDYIRKHGHGSWRALPKLAGLNRCGKSCRLRWTNYLRPDIKRGKFSAEEEQAILNLHSILGNKWSAIATHLPGRTDNEIKNFWNTHLKKKLIQMGFDPMTHRPRTDFFAALPGLLALANLQELVDQRPWEAAEAVQTAKLHYLQYLLQSSSGSSVPQQNPNPNISIDQSTSTLTGINIDQSFNSLQPYGVDTTGLMNQPLAPCSFGQIGESNFVSDELQLIPNCYEQQQQQQQQQPLMESLPPLADFSGPAGNLSGDACSSSSCGVSSNGMPSSFWPEVLLDDPFMNEFA